GRARRPPRLRFVDSNMIDLTRVSVVLPALNEAAALPVALASFPAQVDLVVVDNGSTDATGALGAPAPAGRAARAGAPPRLRGRLLGGRARLARRGGDRLRRRRRLLRRRRPGRRRRAGAHWGRRPGRGLAAGGHAGPGGDVRARRVRQPPARPGLPAAVWCPADRPG